MTLTPEQLAAMSEHLTPEELAEVDKLLMPPVLVTLQDLKIRTKDKKLVPFVPNQVQKLYLQMLAETYPGFDPITGLGLRGVREDVLKARQQGMSTLWLALYFLDTINNPLTETHIYAHDAETTEKLFQTIHRFWDELPAEKKRPKKYSSKKELVFADTGAGVYVGTVSGKALGRGGTVNNAHLSERAWNDNYAELEVGLFEAIPPDGNITRETTANGFNEYKQERDNLRSGKSIFIPRFFGWNLHTDYQRPVPPGFVRTHEEQHLAEAHNLTDRQLMFRREKLATSKEAAAKFPQEYPISEREAFLSTGNPVFDRACLERMESYVESVVPVPLPRFRSEGKVFMRLSREFSAETLTVFEEPREDLVYLVTNDSASGADKNNKLDFCSSSVWGFGQFSGLTQVAHLYGRWEPHEMALLLHELGTWYHKAMVCPLSMNHGQSVWNTLVHTCHIPQNRGNGWGGLYYHNPADINERLTDTKPEQRLPGFPEGGGGKDFMIGAAQEYISDSLITVSSAITLSQCFSYVFLPGGTMGGEAGTHDDAVSDLYTACGVHKLRGHKAKFPHQRRERTPMPPKTFIDPNRARR